MILDTDAMMTLRQQTKMSETTAGRREEDFRRDHVIGQTTSLLDSSSRSQWLYHRYHCDEQ